MTGAVLGIDVGLTATTCVLVDSAGTVLHRTHREHTVAAPRPGHRELDAERDWWGSVLGCLRDLDRETSRVEAVCVSGTGPCVVFCDGDDVPLHPAVLHGIDSRAGEQIDRFNATLGAEAILRRSGKPLSSQALGPKIAWLAEHGIDTGAHRWYSSHNYVLRRLTGRYALDHHTASACDPLYDINTQQWATDWVTRLTPGLHLPDLQWPGEIAGQVTTEAARITGIPSGTPVLAGTVDAWAHAFGAGVRRPGDLMLMYGPSVFMVQVIPTATVAAGLCTTSGVEPGSHTLSAGMAAGGSLTEWLTQLTGATDVDRLAREAAAVPPGSDGLLVLPHFTGDGCPIVDPLARGLIIGLTLGHGRAHLFRAAQEGIAHGIRSIIEALEQAAGPPARVVAVGAATASGLLTQLVSDVCQIDQLVPQATAGACYGDALLAAVAGGLVPAGTDWTTVADVVRADPGTAAGYDEQHRTYLELYPANRRFMHALARSGRDAG